MRNAILAMTMVLTLVTGQLRAATHKTPPADVGPGRIAWFDITTTNLPRSKEFYGKLFDWKIDANNPMNYGIVDNEGQGIGGGISGGDGSSNQVTFYVEVDDPQAYLNKVESQGGKTVMPVTEIPGMVIFAQFADPEGNVVGIVKAGYPGQ